MLLALIFAFFTGTGTLKEIKELSEKYRELSLEEREDKSAEPWRRTNHSFSEINWNPETNEDNVKELCKFWKKKYLVKWSWCWPRPSIERLVEDTGTINYRVLSMFRRTRFLKIYKNRDEEDYKRREFIVSHLQKNKNQVFGEDFIKCLVPLAIDNKNKSDLIDFTPYGSVRAELFPYAHEVGHFNGENKDELISVARVLGKFQKSLQSVNQEELKGITKNYPIIEYLFGPICDRFSRFSTFVEHMRYHNSVATLLYEEMTNLRTWKEKILRIRNKIYYEYPKKNIPLLYDVHPHNVFCKNEECVLIYDYSWIGFWPHSHVLAFSLHRFVREYIIKFKERSPNSDWGKEIKEKAKEFFNIYQDAYNNSFKDDHNYKDIELSLPDDFKSNISGYIMSANMDKLLHVSTNFLSGKDPLQRSIERQLGEVRKFIRYMHEAEKFKID